MPYGYLESLSAPLKRRTRMSVIHLNPEVCFPLSLVQCS